MTQNFAMHLEKCRTWRDDLFTSGVFCLRFSHHCLPHAANTLGCKTIAGVATIALSRQIFFLFALPDFLRKKQMLLDAIMSENLFPCFFHDTFLIFLSSFSGGPLRRRSFLCPLLPLSTLALCPGLE